MNLITFWFLALLGLAVEVLGLVIGRQDVHYAGALATAGVVAVHLLLVRRDGGTE
ncbi:hypothetical protein PUR34_34970 [Streptomyces sp. JV185]|uniref:hypothetical protein n=1 Tax=Streptomyces sp. JV185 TaxID=858638 RepID=UPI002E79ADBA|nr:hypothetical protein [Streptomyces sp. JV185]MEE1773230.1 hypothetical protein [Streptomyces sp. JV185]